MQFLRKKKNIFGCNYLRKMVVFLALLGLLFFNLSPFISSVSAKENTEKNNLNDIVSLPVNPDDKNNLADKDEIKERVDKLNVPFIKNEGQLENKEVEYYANIFTGGFFVTNKGLRYSILNEKRGKENKIKVPDNNLSEESKKKGIAFDEQFVDEKNRQISYSTEGKNQSEASISYFRSNKPENWKRNVPSYNSIFLGELWNNINVHLTAYGKNIEKVFTVESGGDPNDIEIRLEGIDSISVESDGKLLIKTEAGDISMTKPLAFQLNNDGSKVPIEISYEIRKKLNYGFSVGKYDLSKPLVIDPLLASTFLGGSDSDEVYSIDFDIYGNVFVAGITWSNDFPASVGSYQESFGGGDDFFVAKFDEELTEIQSATYIGGSGDGMYGAQIKIDDYDNVFLTGSTNSNDFPTTSGAYQESYGGGFYNAFVLKLDNDLENLLASTYLGRSSYSYAMTIDNYGKVFLTGDSTSNLFPTTPGAYKTVYDVGAGSEVYVSRFDEDLTILEYSTFVGNGGSYSIKVDSGNNVFITGAVNPSAPYYPSTPGAYDTDFSSSKYFISKLTNNLDTLSASTYLGGSSMWMPTANPNMMAIDTSGNVYVTENTPDDDFPTTAGAYQEERAGDVDMFISKFNNDLDDLLASTYLGGTDYDEGHGMIAIDRNGNVFVGSYTNSTDFPTTSGAYQETTSAYESVTLSKLNSNLSSLEASTYFASSDDDSTFPYAIGINSSDNLYFGGATYTSDLPTTPGAYQISLNGYEDGFISRFDNNLSGEIGDHFTVRYYEDFAFQGFEGGTFPPITPNEWTTGGDGDAVWSRRTDYAYDGSLGSAGAYESGYMETSWLETDYDFLSDGSIKFYWKTIADEDNDFLSFCQDNSSCSSDNADIKITGEEDWTLASIPVTAGHHHFRWVFENGGLEGADMGWIDNVRFMYENDSPTFDPGDANEIEILAYNTTGDILSSYNGDKIITISGANPYGGNNPTCTDKDGEDVDFGDPTTITFANGVATCDMKLYISETAHIDVDDGTFDSTDDPDYDLDVTVSGTPVASVSADNSIISVLPFPSSISNQVTLTLTAYDTNNDPYLIGGDTIIFNIAGSNPGTPAVTDNNDGTYTATYTPAVEGVDQITATINGDAVGKDNDGTSDGIFNLTVSSEPVPITEPEEEPEEESDHLTLINFKDKTLTFDAYISRGKSEKEKVFSEDDQGTQVKEVKLKSDKNHKIDGEFEVKKVKDPKIPELPKELSGSSCSVYTQVKVKADSSIDGQDIQSAIFQFRISKKYKQEHPNANFSVVQKKGEKVKLLEKNKNKANEIAAESPELEGVWTVLDCLSKKIEGRKLINYSIPATPLETVPSEPVIYPPVEPVPEKENLVIEKKEEKKPITKEEKVSIFEKVRKVLGVNRLVANGIIAIGAIIPLLSLPFQLNSISDMGLLFKESMFRIFGFLGWRKKQRRDWGIVYDVDTGVPIPLAAVQVIDKISGKVKETRLTDSLGSYYFLVSPGTYVLDPEKKDFSEYRENNYSAVPVWYKNTYRYAPLEYKDYAKIDADIPMQAVSENAFNTNKINGFWKSFIGLIFWLGFVVNMIILFFEPNILNGFVALAYLGLEVMRRYGTSSTKWGLVVNSEGIFQPFATLKLYKSENRELVARAITDEQGRYFLIANPGDYILTTETTNGKNSEINFSLTSRNSVKYELRV